MAATGFTPISIFYSTTASTAPTAGSLVNGELAINITDGVLYYKDNAGAVQKIGTKGGVGTSSTTQVLYNSSGLVVGSANLTFNGTTLTTANDASISGLTVGKGANAVAYNTAVGASALASGSLSGGFNSAFGNVALNANTTGASNSAFGYAALNSNTTGSSNTAYGLSSLLNNTTASNNTAVGYQAAYSNTTVGSNSVAVGYQALYGATNGYNVGVGSLTLTGSGNGYYNVAVGYTAGQANTTGYTNTFIGMAAGAANTTANQNTFVGQNAGTATTTGGGNTYVGLGAGQYNTTGTQNTLIGIGSGYTLTTGSKNSILGGYNGNQGGLDIRTASNYIVLSDGDGNPRGVFDNAGAFVVAQNGQGGLQNYNGFCYSLAANCVVINHVSGTGNGTTYQYFGYAGSGIGSISQAGTTGVLYNVTSDYRLKDVVSTISDSGSRIDALQPINYTMKTDGSAQRGFLAHQFQAIYPNSVSGEKDAVDAEGKPIYQAMQASTSEVMADLIAEIQSLRKRVALLESK